jgi:hypothetical protein
LREEAVIELIVVSSWEKPSFSSSIRYAGQSPDSIATCAVGVSGVGVGSILVVVVGLGSAWTEVFTIAGLHAVNKKANVTMTACR